MLPRIFHFFRSYGLLCFVVVVALLACITTYRPDTFLTGWDNLHPEFNPIANLKRAFFAVWQEYQGLGLLGGMGHAADLPRQLLLYPFTFIFPVSFIRYLFHFSMLITGIIGIYVVLHKFFLSHGHEKMKVIGATLGSLFYLLNLGTAQIFIAPFEPFSVFYGAYPWLVYVLLQYLNNPSRKNLFILGIINLLASPLAYVQTVFYVYALTIAILLVSYITKHKDSCKKVGIVIGALFIMNAYWFLPNLYWIVTSWQVTQNAMVNKLTTNETFEETQEYGSLNHFALLRNKVWEYRNFTITQADQPFLMESWHTHFSNPLIPIIGFLFFGICLLGLFSKSPYRRFLVALFFLVVLALLSNTIPFNFVNSLFRSIPILHQALRDPFTKFIVPAIFVFSVGFSLGMTYLISLVKKIFGKQSASIIAVGFIFLLILYGFPMINGNLIAEKMKVATPSKYFELIDYFKNQDKQARIVNLPQGSIWGWSSYDWEYTGSGFLWYGIEQPILDRAFDVWSNENENYYYEVTYALYKKDPVLFSNILSKYNIKYVLFDDAIFFPDNPNSNRLTQDQKEFVSSHPSLQLEKTFGTAHLYQVKNSEAMGFLSTAKSPAVTNSTDWNNNDQIYSQQGNYQTVLSKQNSQIYYPFSSIFSGRGSDDLPFSVNDVGEYYRLQPKKTVNVQNLQTDITIPFPNEFVERNQEDLQLTINKQPLIEIPIGISYVSSTDVRVKEGAEFAVNIPKIRGYGSYESSKIADVFLGNAVDCNVGDEEGRLFSQRVRTTDITFVRFISSKAHNCRAIYLPNFEHNRAYILGVSSRNLQGNTLKVWIENLTDKRVDQYISLNKHNEFKWEYLILPPMSPDGVGYAVHVDNISNSPFESINDLAGITLYPFPYQFLTNLSFKEKNVMLSISALDNSIEATSHLTLSSYEVTMNSQDTPNTLILSQSFDSGWQAYYVTCNTKHVTCKIKNALPFLFGKRLEDHVLVNNWANGWVLPEAEKDPKIPRSQDPNEKDNETMKQSNNATIKIIYTPQYLEYIGFGMLVIGLLFVIRYKHG